MHAPSGIRTFYKGTEYRSRLEARWACFFDLLGWKFEYEPFDMDYYIPDFLLLGDAPVLVEVKPYATLSEFKPLESNLPDSVYPFLLVASTPFFSSFYGLHLGRTCDASKDGYLDETPGVRYWGEAALSRCHMCREFYFVNESMAWDARGPEHPCGYCRKPGLSYEDEALARGYWAQAQNLTKWAA